MLHPQQSAPRVLTNIVDALVRTRAERASSASNGGQGVPSVVGGLVTGSSFYHQFSSAAVTEVVEQGVGGVLAEFGGMVAEVAATVGGDAELLHCNYYAQEQAFLNPHAHSVGGDAKHRPRGNGLVHGWQRVESSHRFVDCSNSSSSRSSSNSSNNSSSVDDIEDDLDEEHSTPTTFVRLAYNWQLWDVKVGSALRLVLNAVEKNK